jgi:tRNA A-37 threonylcarbamoyl transferase component Bud32
MNNNPIEEQVIDSDTTWLPPDPLLGSRLANFVIEGVLRRGGMAQVYHGLDVMLERKVAIKVIDARYRSQPTYAERFLREARSVAAWHHPHIIQIYYADKQEGLYYFVMELIDGYDLGELIHSYTLDGELLSHEDVLRIGWAVARALDFAHGKGVIHRDVKPSNVMVARDGRILLMDFGLALAIDEGSEGEILGTVHYVAPEQAQGSANAVPQSDLYSLGVMLYEMLTGARPFDDPKSVALAMQHVLKPPPPPREINPALSEEVEQVLLKALEKTPERRYQTAVALLTALTEALAVGEPVPGGRIYLPPLPAGIQADRMATSVSRLSHLSVVDKIASRANKMPPEPIPTAAEMVAASDPLPADLTTAVATADAGTTLETAPETAVFSRFSGWWVGLAGLLVLLLVGGVWGQQAGWFAGLEATPLPVAVVPVSTATPTATATATATATPSATPDVTATTAAATGTAVVAIPPTGTPTFTPEATATATAEPTPTIPPVIEATATLDRAEGHRVRFYYDDFSFYIWNPEPAAINVASLSFEALTADGEVAGYVFRGRSWADIYPFLEEGRCNRIRPAAVPETPAPFVCTQFNASLTLARDDEGLFWLPHDGAVNAFRVYWFGTIVGSCPLITGVCELSLPTSIP